MKDKTSNIFDAGTLLTALFHFVACGLPAIVALLGAAGILVDIPGINISPAAMRTVMIVSGAMLALSVASYMRGCGCGGKTRRARKFILIAAAIFYAAGLAGHFMPSHHAQAPCHQEARHGE
ncbi:MAG: hypothetical protein LBI17_00560 [Rickettsiales bacterium]|nr:hypothetical protein [Rickettsiales bacterium]